MALIVPHLTTALLMAHLDLPVRGQLQEFALSWDKFVTDSLVKGVLTEGYNIFTRSHIQSLIQDGDVVLVIERTVPRRVVGGSGFKKCILPPSDSPRPPTKSKVCYSGGLLPIQVLPFSVTTSLQVFHQDDPVMGYLRL